MPAHKGKAPLENSIGRLYPVGIFPDVRSVVYKSEELAREASPKPRRPSTDPALEAPEADSDFRLLELKDHNFPVGLRLLRLDQKQREGFDSVKETEKSIGRRDSNLRQRRSPPDGQGFPRKCARLARIILLNFFE